MKYVPSALVVAKWCGAAVGHTYTSYVRQLANQGMKLASAHAEKGTCSGGMDDLTVLCVQTQSRLFDGAVSA